MELNRAILLLLISSPLLSFLADAICLPRNCTQDQEYNISHGPTSSSSVPASSPSPTTPLTVPSSSPISSPEVDSPAKSPSSTIDLSLPLPSFANPVIQKICGATSHPQECLSSVVPYLTGDSDPVSVLEMEMQALHKGFEKAAATARELQKKASTSAWVKSCLDTCLEVYESGIADLSTALTAISSHDIGTVKINLSSTISDMEICEDSFAEEPGVESPMKSIDEELEKLASNNLAIATMLHWK